jgi:predicted phosphodiesterase
MTNRPRVLYLLIIVCLSSSAGLILLNNRIIDRTTSTEQVQSFSEDYGESKTVIAVGDIACPRSQVGQKPNECKHDLVADKIKLEKLDGLFLLGDIQYPNGEKTDLDTSFVPAFGSLLSKAYITIGNHEYNVDTQATPIRQLAQNLGAKISTAEQPYSKSTIGDWSVYLLDSNCDKVGGCSKESQQYKWLEQQLADDKSRCSVALWHHPVLASAGYAFSKSDLDRMRDIWQLARSKRVDIVLNGHEHIYERFAPSLVDNFSSPVMRQFTVGTGGVGLRALQTNTPYRDAAIADKFGYLKLKLHQSSYAWEFIGADKSAVLDSGTGKCY